MTLENTEVSAQVEAGESAPAAVDGEDAALLAAFNRMTGPDRDEGGRFAGQEQLAATETETEIDAATQEQPAATETQAPAHLPQAIKAVWDKMPEDARSAVAAHQQEMDRKFGEVGKQYAGIKPIADRLNAATQQMPELFAGLAPEQLAQGALELAAVQVRLNRDPVGTVLQIAEHYGVLGHIAQRLTGQQAQPGAQVVPELQRQIAELRKQISTAASPQIVDQRLQQVMAQKEAETAILALHQKEHWGDVEASISAFVPLARQQLGGGVSNAALLDAAYDMAVNALPAVREKVRASEAAKAATVGAPDPKRTEAAKRAASINVKSNQTGNGQPITEEDAMRAAYNRVMSS